MGELPPDDRAQERERNGQAVHTHTVGSGARQTSTIQDRKGFLTGAKMSGNRKPTGQPKPLDMAALCRVGSSCPNMKVALRDSSDVALHVTAVSHHRDMDDPSRRNKRTVRHRRAGLHVGSLQADLRGLLAGDPLWILRACGVQRQ